MSDGLDGYERLTNDGDYGSNSDDNHRHSDDAQSEEDRAASRA